MYRNFVKFSTFVLVIAGIWLTMQYFLPLFFPFLLGTALALISEPMVSFLSKKAGLVRGAAVGIGVTAALCFLALMLVLLCALVLRELAQLAAVLPNLEDTAENSISALSAWVSGIISRLPPGIRDVLSRSASDFFSGSSAVLDRSVRYVVNLTGGVLRQVPDGALILGTTVISGYMISAKLPAIRLWLKARLSTERIRKLLRGVRRIRSAIFGWLKAQCKLMGITWLILTMGLILLRVTYAPVWSAVIALVDAFPILGTGTVLLPWALVCFVQADTARAVGLLSIYAVISLTRSALEPKLLGKHLGLDPLVTLAAVYVGYKLWGIGGMLLAPLLAVAASQILRPADQEM